MFYTFKTKDEAIQKCLQLARETKRGAYYYQIVDGWQVSDRVPLLRAHLVHFIDENGKEFFA